MEVMLLKPPLFGDLHLLSYYKLVFFCEVSEKKGLREEQVRILNHLCSNSEARIYFNQES